jgi:hypothetical protein
MTITDDGAGNVTLTTEVISVWTKRWKHWLLVEVPMKLLMRTQEID